MRNCEFDGKHLTLVLKKNQDNKTVIVVPLTRSSNGDGQNKVNIGEIEGLPSNLKTGDSYAVYNQVRTLNCNRFYALKDDLGNRVSVNIKNEVF